MRTPRLLVLLLTLASPPALADIVVIANVNGPVKQLTATEIRDLYLGRVKAFSNGTFAQVFDHRRDAALRDRFFQAIAGMSQPQVNAYWSRLAFSGQVQPPQTAADDRGIVELVRATPAGIGYVSAERVDGSVKVLLTLKD